MYTRAFGGLLSCDFNVEYQWVRGQKRETNMCILLCLVNFFVFWVNFCAISFMKLDLGRVVVYNSFVWHVGDKDVVCIEDLDIL